MSTYLHPRSYSYSRAHWCSGSRTPRASSQTPADRPRRVRRDPGRLTRIEATLLALIVLALFAGALAPAFRSAVPEPEAYASTVVPEDGTLWEIALRHPADGLSTAQTVALIRRVNSLDTGVIYPGQTLRVPARVGQAAVAQR